MSQSPELQTARTALVKKEGWMLLRSPVRVLMVAVQDPAALFDLSQSEESPVPIPGGDSPGGGGAGGGALGAGRKEDSDDSDEEEMTPAQRKELKQAMRELRALSIVIGVSVVVKIL